MQSKVVLRRAIGVFLMTVSIWLASCQAFMHQFSRDEPVAERPVTDRRAGTGS